MTVTVVMVHYLSFTIFNPAKAAKSLQSCPTLCDPRDGSPPGSPVPGILQTRTLEWVAISFSNAGKWKVKVKVKSLSRVQLLATPWTAAHQAPPSMGFSRQEYWSGAPLPSLIILYRRQQTNHPKEKEKQEGQVVTWGGFTNSRRMKRRKKQGREGKKYPIKRRVPKSS